MSSDKFHVHYMIRQVSIWFSYHNIFKVFVARDLEFFTGRIHLIYTGFVK